MLEKNGDLTADGSKTFKYKAGFIEKTVNLTGGKSFVKNVIIATTLKYLSIFWRLLERPLINCEVHLDLTLIFSFDKGTAKVFFNS